jgi:hydroxyacylglutathione hydrolase
VTTAGARSSDTASRQTARSTAAPIAPSEKGSRAPAIAWARRLPPIDRLADDVFQLRGRPRNAVNVYLAGDLLIDAGTSNDRKRILSQLADRTVTAHALTHAHPDHHGSSHAVCEALKIPLWCGEDDASVAEGERLAPGKGRMAKLISRLPAPQPHPVERRLKEGDQVAAFTVLETPGHSPGHVAYWRESDRTLICGDVLFNLGLPTLRPGLREPYAALTPDPAKNRDSARRLAELRPSLVLFGHGPPLRDSDRFVRFVESLPA